MDAQLEVVPDVEALGGAERGSHHASGDADQGGERGQEEQPEYDSPEQAAEASPCHRMVGGRGDMKLPLLVAPDDGGVFEVDQVVALKLDEFLPDVLGRLLVRIADNDQVA